MGSPKRWGIIKPSERSKLQKNVDEKWNKANGNDMLVNCLIVLLCKTYKKTLVRLDKRQLEDGPWTQWTPTSLCLQKTTLATWIATWRSATHVGGGSLALGDQETQAGAPTSL